MDLPVTPDDVVRAASAIAGGVLRTPTTLSRTLSEISKTEVYVKFENLQFTASYKERGALNKLLSLSEQERRAGVVASSAGNFAQAVAYHARRLGIAATLVMPSTTPSNKVSRTEVLGARIILEGRDVDEAAGRAAEIAAATGAVLLSPFDDPHVIAGGGTVALEMLEDAPHLDVLVVPVGGGGLVAGMGLVALGRGVDVVGVQSEVYPSMVCAVRGIPPPAGGSTIAEGIAVREAGRLTTAIVKALEIELVTVSEAHLEEAVALYLEIEKVVAEGAGAAPLAALLEHPSRFRGHRAGLVLSGGNIDLHLLASVITRSLVRTGRLVTLRVTVTDAPGSLATVTSLVAEAGGNIIDVRHRRHILAVPSRAAQLECTVEVAGADAAQLMIEHIRNAGFPVETVEGGLT